MGHTGRADDGGRLIDEVPFMSFPHVDFNLSPKIIYIIRVSAQIDQDFINLMDMGSCAAA
jgi:hypothetical protein